MKLTNECACGHYKNAENDKCFKCNDIQNYPPQVTKKTEGEDCECCWVGECNCNINPKVPDYNSCHPHLKKTSERIKELVRAGNLKTQMDKDTTKKLDVANILIKKLQAENQRLKEGIKEFLNTTHPINNNYQYSGYSPEAVAQGRIKFRILLRKENTTSDKPTNQS